MISTPYRQYGSNLDSSLSPNDHEMDQFKPYVQPYDEYIQEYSTPPLNLTHSSNSSSSIPCSSSKSSPKSRRTPKTSTNKAFRAPNPSEPAENSISLAQQSGYNNAVVRSPRSDSEALDKQTQAMIRLKLRRISEVNDRLREDLSRERIYASSACLAVIQYTQQNIDYCLPGIWGYLPEDDPQSPVERRHSHNSASCCIIS